MTSAPSSTAVRLPDGAVEIASLPKERVASYCVCCGGRDLETSPAILMPFIAERVFGWKPVRIDASWGLKTIPEGMAFSICNTLFCRDCGLLFCDLRFSDAEMDALYKDYRGETYTKLRDAYEPGYAARNTALNEQIGYLDAVEAFIAPHLHGPPRLLDWGGGTGKNTPFAGRAEQIDIFDISEVPVLDGMRAIGHAEAVSQTYDLVLCNMVLEHVSYPSDLLRDIQAAMSNDTILYIEVPFEPVMRAEEPVSSSVKRHWHEHLNFYSEDSLRRLAANSGLETIALNVLATDVAGTSINIFQLLCRRFRG